MTLTVLLVLAIGFGAYMAWSIGANDVANAMGTSVGSGALTLKRAIIVAAIFEFCGAFFAGGTVVDTVRKGIVDPSVFAGEPMILAAGMTAALLSAAIWLHVASHLGLPVSTTHSIVGSVAGFGIVHAGMAGVKWSKLGTIVASWVVSPVCGGVLGLLAFVAIERAILNKEHPLEAFRRWGPVLVFPVFMILTLSLLFKGLKNLNLDLPFSTGMVYGAIVGAVASVVAVFFFRRLRLREGETREDEVKRTEGVFAYLQIMTASFVAFAHGSNDVANAVGPLAAVAGIAEAGSVTTQVALPVWVLLLGSVGIVVGLATFGAKVMATIGTKITEMTPSRGATAEFAAATTILAGTKLGLPISTTHTLVGAVIGVGLARGRAELNTGVVKNIALSWVVTVPVGGALSALIFLLLRAFM